VSEVLVLSQYQNLEQNSMTRLGQLTHLDRQTMTNYAPAVHILPKLVGNSQQIKNHYFQAKDHEGNGQCLPKNFKNVFSC